MKHVLFALLSLLSLAAATASACTGISLCAADGSFLAGRTIDWAASPLESGYVVLPRGHVTTSRLPDGGTGMTFTARYGVVGLTVVCEEYIAEGLNEAGLAAGLFFFPRYGSYAPFDPAERERTLADLQVAAWMLSQFATVAEVRTAMAEVRVIGLIGAEAVHWRIADAKGEEAVMEIIESGTVRFYDNTVGVLTNAPSFSWQVTNLDNYVNLRPGTASPDTVGRATLVATGGGSGLIGLPGDPTPPSRFVRATFARATAPTMPDGQQAATLCFHLLNGFDIPIGMIRAEVETSDNPFALMSATQWTSVIDLTARNVYYKTARNNTLRRIALNSIDFISIQPQWHPLDTVSQQPVIEILIP